MIDSAAPGDVKANSREVRLGDEIEIFRDYETELISEGYARVWAILEEDPDYYVLYISFRADPKAPDRKYTRKYRKRQT